ncbi:MAG TPA: hypothetical protein VFA76_16375 [Terriglobales bacterium]|nr:hypothetical protein [Terriglobales bacterium]
MADQIDQLIVARKPKRALLPLLTVLFVVAYGLMTMVIVEQGNTINSQGWLIRELFHDSQQLNSLKAQIGHQEQAAKPGAPAADPQVQKGGKKPQKVQPQVAPDTDKDEQPSDVRRTLIIL